MCGSVRKLILYKYLTLSGTFTDAQRRQRISGGRVETKIGRHHVSVYAFVLQFRTVVNKDDVTQN